MSDGKTHAVITVTAAVVTSTVMWRYGFSAQEIRHVAEGCLSGVILSPDMDVDGGFIGYYYVNEYLGKIVGTAWKVLWWPYAVLVPHRHWISHAPIISTILRLLYWYGIYAVGSILIKYPVWLPTYDQVGFRLYGLMLSDALHYIADIISTSNKRRKSRAHVHFPMSEMPANRRGRTRSSRTASKQTQRLRR